MDPKRLDFIEAHFKNPPSAACNRELAQELVDALRLAQKLHREWRDASPGAAGSGPISAPESIMKVVDEQHFGGAKHADPLDVIEPKKKAKR